MVVCDLWLAHPQPLQLSCWSQFSSDVCWICVRTSIVWSGFASTSVFVEYKPRSVGFRNKNRNFKQLRAQLTHFKGGGDASDNRNGVLQAKLLQLGAEGVLLVLEEHGGRGRQQLLPGELVGWRLGRRRRLHPFVEQRREGTQFLRHVPRVFEDVR